MTDTARLALPLLEAAQAQKHVTMNEALARLDALTPARVEALARTDPPAAAEEGRLWGIGAGAGGAWAGQEGRVALAVGGGWTFVDPWDGWRVWDAESGGCALWRGGAWHSGWLSGADGGAATVGRVIAFDHALAAGPSSDTVAAIPDKAVVLGVTGRVLVGVTGAAAWSLGVAGAPDRYGSGYGTTADAFAHGMTGQPQVYFGDTALVLTAEGGDFAGGLVRLAVHVLTLSPPDPA
jgi:hypothetical protein